MASSRGEPACPASTASFPSSDMHPALMSLLRLLPMRSGCMVGGQLKVSSVVARTHLTNRERARCQRFGAAARSKCFRTGSPSGRAPEYPLRIFDRRATPQQRQRSATRRAVFWRAPGCVAPQSQSRVAMLLRRALPAARQKTARPFHICEMGSCLFADSNRMGKGEPRWNCTS